MKTEPEPDNLSPEEKLLRVIRGEENAAPAASAMPPVVRPKLKKSAAPVQPAPTATVSDVKPPSAAKPVPAPPAQPIAAAARPVLAPAARVAPAPVPAKPATKPVAMPAAIPAAKPAVKPQVRPRLKPVAATPPRSPAAATTRPTPVKETAAAPATSTMVSDPNAPTGKPAARRSRLGVASRLLALAALVFLLLSAWEIWGAYQSADPRAPSVWRAPDDEPVVPFVADTPPLPDLDSILALYRQRPLLVQPKGPDSPGPQTPSPGPTPQTDWEQYLRDHLKLLGFSRIDGPDGGMEALVSDANTGRMHYLRVGSPLLAEGRQLTVAAIEKDKIVLTDGDRKIPVR